MVRKIRVDLGTPDGGTIAFEYQNETAVGLGADKPKRTDVQLVQLFLFNFFEKNPGLFARLPKTNPDTGAILIDGKVGPQTTGGIIEVQKFVRSKSGLGFIDGVVSVARGRGPIPGGQSAFTISQLNGTFWIDKKNRGFNERFQDHPALFLFSLAELQAELATLKDP